MPRRARAGGGKPGDVASVEDNAAAIGPHLAGEQGDERRLAGAVRADKAVHFSRRDLELDVAVGYTPP